MNQKYPKREHLKKDNDIKYLFENGIWCQKYPLRLIYCISPSKNNLSKIGVSVSKRNFKKAVHRNYIKRLIRECYRLNKSLLQDKLNNHLIMIIYTGKEILPFQEIEKNYLRILEKLPNSNLS